ncbi:MAG: response regulator transcription factor [Anaerolineae bacterium]|nr:response regulator transcription factor [Anaerolineae bacterium]
MNDKILIIDDDPSFTQIVHLGLTDAGYRVTIARDGQEGIRLFFECQPDLIILDITMPRLDGYQVCQRVRDIADTPIIMLTALDKEEDIIKGLEFGADDYLTKPFRTGELVARVQATLRRSRTAIILPKNLSYQDNHLFIDLETRRIEVKGKLVKLTPTEYKLLELLFKNKGRIIETQQILEKVWGFEYIDDVDYLRVYIWHLRRKLEPDPKNPIYLLNEQYVGYRFEVQN